MINRLRRQVARRLAPAIGGELAPHIIHEIDSRVQKVDSRIHEVDSRINKIDDRMHEVDGRLMAAIDRLSRQSAEFSNQLEALKNTQAELLRNVAATEQGSDLVYDVGMNNGDDCEYYLAKGYRVVGIDADPALCGQVSQRFSSEIADGRLRIINTAIGETEGVLDFYVNSRGSVWSTLVPQDLLDGDWRTIAVSVRPLSALIKEYGTPHYVKIDIEGYDSIALHDLSRNEIRPYYISAECHQIEILCRLATMGYQKFKMTACHLVDTEYQDHTITTRAGTTAKFSFKPHSSGPFGRDIPGPWLDLEEAIRAWLERDPGWYDFHAKVGF